MGILLVKLYNNSLNVLGLIVIILIIIFIIIIGGYGGKLLDIVFNKSLGFWIDYFCCY